MARIAGIENANIVLYQAEMHVDEASSMIEEMVVLLRTKYPTMGYNPDAIRNHANRIAELILTHAKHLHHAADKLQAAIGAI